MLFRFSSISACAFSFSSSSILTLVRISFSNLSFSNCFLSSLLSFLSLSSHSHTLYEGFQHLFLTMCILCFLLKRSFLLCKFYFSFLNSISLFSSCFSFLALFSCRLKPLYAFLNEFPSLWHPATCFHSVLRLRGTA